MRAVQISTYGGYDVLDMAEVAKPQAGPDKVLVELRFAAISPLDATVRAGHLPARLHKPLPLTPGGQAVGVVVDGGGNHWRPGTRVALSGGRYGVAEDGTWAEYLAVDPAHLVGIPDSVDDESAAALTAGGGYLTAYMALTDIANIRTGSWVLAPGIGGAVGQGGADLGPVLGAQVISTASTTAKAERGRAAGFTVIDLSVETLHDGVARLTRGYGVDIVLDSLGGWFTGAALSELAPDGTLISIGYVAGTHAEVDVTEVIWKNAHVHGFRFGLFSDERIAAANGQLFDLLAAGALSPIVDRVYPLAWAAAAQQYLAEARPFGRVLLSNRPS